jgi:hypothetical protein
LELFADLHDVDVGDDVARVAFVEVAARLWLEPLNDAMGLDDFVDGRPERFCEFFVAARFEVGEMLIDDLHDVVVRLVADEPQLYEQAFAQIDRSAARRLELQDDLARFVDGVDGATRHERDLLGRGREVAVALEVLNDDRADAAAPRHSSGRG